MKYLVYRSFGRLEDSVKKHELIAVEYGKDIHEVADKIVKEVEADMASIPEYAGLSIAAYAPKEVEYSRRVKKYDYYVDCIAAYPVAPKHKRIEYGIVETEGNEPL